MTNLSSGNIAKLNKMNKAAQNVYLGTLLSTMESGSATLASNATKSGKVTISDTQANASAVVIDTKLSSITGYIVQTYNTGSPVQGAYVTTSSASLTVLPNTKAYWGSNGSYVISSSYVINWIAW